MQLTRRFLPLGCPRMRQETSFRTLERRRDIVPSPMANKIHVQCLCPNFHFVGNDPGASCHLSGILIRCADSMYSTCTVHTYSADGNIRSHCSQLHQLHVTD
ncbi:hypothetical protein I7I48_09947 [Histoplasma ohiense]|nr:hypothetical protein I7I48_09947 [Histoplasma ohiense (nom. inval.)]